MLLDGTQEPVPWYTRPNPLDLLTTCRPVYVKWVGILCGSHTFVVNDPQVLLHLHGRFTSPRRLQAIGKLDVGFVSVGTRVGNGCIYFFILSAFLVLMHFSLTCCAHESANRFVKRPKTS